MNLLRLSVLPAAVLLLACSSDDGPDSTTGDAATGTPISRPALDEIDLVDLVYWESFYGGTYGPPGPRREATLEAIAEASQDEPAYRAILIDLAIYPTPYRDLAWELLDTGAPFSTDTVLAAFGDQGRLTPEDDLESYAAFKARLLGTIDPGFEDFLDPAAPRIISAREVIWGGVPVDGIPPLHDPGFVSADDAAEWILPSDLIIGVEINGDARAYPRRIIDWHEMVNDTVGGVPVSLAYCTLCGSAILYDGRVGDDVYRFGTSGMLYRSNKLMYDTTTGSLWEQYTGEPAWGELVGTSTKLDVLPAVHVTWAEWLTDHPDTLVLDIDTGFRRNYDSGVAYADYWASPDLRFPAPDEQGPLALKDVVYTIRLGGETVAYPVDVLAERSVIHDEVAGTPLVVITSEDGSGGRAYESGDVRFASLDSASDTLIDSDGGGWLITEDALLGPDSAELARLPGHNSFWFAIVNHATNWRLYEE